MASIAQLNGLKTQYRQKLKNRCPFHTCMAKSLLSMLLREIKGWYVIEPESYPDFGKLRSYVVSREVDFFGYDGGAIRLMTRDPVVMLEPQFANALARLKREYSVYEEPAIPNFVEVLICPLYEPF